MQSCIIGSAQKTVTVPILSALIYTFPMDKEQYIDTVACIFLKGGKVLSTRSRGKDTYYIPGGKRNGNETDEQVLIREIKEEVAVDLIPETVEYYGTFEAQAHGRPEGIIVRMACYMADFSGEPEADSEKEEVVWLGYEGREKSSSVDKLVFDDLKNKGFLA